MDPSKHVRAAAKSGGPRHARLRRRSLGAVGAGVAVIVALSATGPLAGATPTYKIYSATESPSPIYMGAATPVTITLKNSAISNQPFASAELTVGTLPASAVGSVSTVPAGWSAQVVNNAPATILLTSPNAPAIAPGSSLAITFAITPTTASPITVGTVVKQSNNFSGTGNNFKNSGSDPVIDVTPLTIAFDQQPSVVQQSVPNTSTFSGMCPAVSVKVTQGVDGPGVQNITVTLANGGQTDPGLYWNELPIATSVPTAVTDADGVATFGDCSSPTLAADGLAATNVGSGYELSASSPAAGGSVLSSPFSVVQFLGICTGPDPSDPAGTCNSPNLNSPTNGTTATINATFQTPGELLGSFGQGALSCDSQVTNSKVHADPFDSQSLATTQESVTASGTVTITFPKAVVNNLANNGTPLMQVCAGASDPFLPNQTPIAGATYPYQGLVPNCPSNYQSSTGLPLLLCVVSRSKHAANEIIQIYTSDLSDPSYW